MKVQIGNGPELEVVARAIPLQQWPEAAEAYVNRNEFHLIALSTGLLRSQIEQLKPEDYSSIYKLFEEANRDFFEYASRQLVIASMSRAMLQRISG